MYTKTMFIVIFSYALARLSRQKWRDSAITIRILYKLAFTPLLATYGCMGQNKNNEKITEKMRTAVL